MKLSWQTEIGHLVCRWSQFGERVQYNPPWIQDTSRDVLSNSLTALDFTRLSPFSGSEWYEAQLRPDNSFQMESK